MVPEPLYISYRRDPQTSPSQHDESYPIVDSSSIHKKADGVIPRRLYIEFTSHFIKEPIRSFIPATTLAGFLTIPAASRALSAN